MENSKILEGQMHELLGFEPAVGNYSDGIVWQRNLISPDKNADCQMTELLYDREARSNWHVHPGAKIIMVTEGEGYLQEEGSPVKRLHFGDVIKIAPGIKHWHGATNKGRLMHITIALNLLADEVQWLEPVHDNW